MRLRATNAALRDVRDEAAIIMNFWENPHMNSMRQQPPQPLMERWREVTAWLAEDGAVLIINEEARHIIEVENPCLKETLEEIRQSTALEADWNDEGAPVIDRAVILWVTKFVQWLECIAAEQHFTGDCAPAVFPTIDGGVKLYWKVRERQVALAFHPDQDSIDIMEKTLGAPATHRAVAENEAGAVALEAMSEVV
jgi:hypothetical protein